jgi:hypothetical protein
MAMLGGECSSCCGGWYCCKESPAPCSVADLINSAVVTVSTGSDYVSEMKISPGQAGFNSHQCQSGLVQWYTKMIAIVPSSHYAGTFSLNRLSDTSFGYSYQADTAGCSASLTLELQASALAEYSYLGRLRLDYRSYQWRKDALSYPSETKTLSQMQCASTEFYSNCTPLPFEQYRSEVFPHTQFQSQTFPTWHFSVPRCPGPFTYQYNGNFWPLGTGFFRVSESGSLAYSISLTLNHA